jgi:phospholipid/cholesterol/gamma-HCH transport system substrate-binding protein
MEILVGGSVFLSLFILIAGVMWLKEASMSGKLVQYTIIFSNVGVLQPGDPVTVNGIKRGSIGKMELQGSKVAVVINIDKNVVLTDSCAVSVQNIGLMGERMIGIALSEKGTPYQPSTKKSITYIPGNFDSGIAEAMAMLGRVLIDAEELLGVVRSVIDQTVGDTGFVDFFNNLIVRLDTVSYVVENLVVTNKSAVQNAITNLQEVTADVKGILDANSGRIENILENGSNLTDEAVVIAANLDTISVAVKSMLTNIEKGEGTIGLLMKDETFFRELKSSLADIDTLVDEINKDGLKLRVKLGFGRK